MSGEGQNGTDRPLSMTFAAPQRYVQGVGALADVPGVLEGLGVARPLVLRDSFVAELLGDRLDSISGAITVEFGGECSPDEIDRVSDVAAAEDADCVVAVGGGKTMDTAKAVAQPGGLRLVIVPTIASTDAPTSALSVVYSDAGEFLEYRFYDRNPDAVVVDTGVVAAAPTRFLVAGMGDALATWFEADASSRTRAQAMAGGAPTASALALAQLCYRLLREYGVAARLAVEQNAVNLAVERIVEANTLLSGLGFESGGLAAAHAIHNGLTALEPTHEFQHGEKVAFGLASMLMLEERPVEEIDEVFDFCLSVGLPVTLSDIGLGDAGEDDLRKVAEAACAPGETIHNEPFPVHPSMVVGAMRAADAYGRHRRALVGGESVLPTVAS